MTKVKICGLKTIKDIQAVNRWKPDFAGFVLHRENGRSLLVMPQSSAGLLIPGYRQWGFL